MLVVDSLSSVEMSRDRYTHVSVYKFKMLTDMFFILVFQNSIFSAIKIQNNGKFYFQVDRKSNKKKRQYIFPMLMLTNKILLNILSASSAKSIVYFEIFWVIKQGLIQNLLNTPATYALV